MRDFVVDMLRQMEAAFSQPDAAERVGLAAARAAVVRTASACQYRSGTLGAYGWRLGLSSR